MVSNTHITLPLRQEKERKGVNAGLYKNVRQIATYEPPRIAALVREFFKGQAEMERHIGTKLARRWSLTAREDVEVWSALTLTDWLRAAFTAAGQLPLEGFS